MTRRAGARTSRDANKVGGAIAALAAALMLGACSQTSDLLQSASFFETTTASADEPAQSGGSELQKATAYWGQEWSKKPSDLKTGLNYARNLKALGEKQKALGVLQQLAVLHDGDPELAGEYGRLALELNQVAAASKLLAIADNPAKPDWRIISARGTVYARRGDFKQAIKEYERALAQSNQPSVLNNLAMAHAMSGDAVKAEELLRQAAALEGKNAKVQQNLALVLGLQGRYDEAKTSIAAAEPASKADVVKSDTDLLRQTVKVQAKADPNSFATTTTTVPAKTSPQPFRPAIVDGSQASWDATVAVNAAQPRR